MIRFPHLIVLILAGVLALTSPAAAAPSERFVTVAPDVRLHVVVAGAVSARPTLVLVPGWRLTSHVWREQVARFSADRRVIAIDPRSQGDSTKTPDGDTPEQRAKDLHAVIAALAPGPVVIVGWSQGVQDVAAYVDQFGTAGVKGVVLVDSTVSAGAPGVKQAPEAAAAQLRLLSLYAHYPRDATEGMIHAIIRTPQPPAEINLLVEDGMKTPPAIGAAMLADDLFGPDRTPAMAKMDVPVLVIASAYSGELEGQRAMAAKIKSARFEVIADAGHAVFIDQPQKFDELLGQFLAGLG